MSESVSDAFLTPASVVRETDVTPDRPTRDASVKWVMVVDRDLPLGLIANATACMAAAVGHHVPRVLGAGGKDGSGAFHQGLPWTGCSILGADAPAVADVRSRAAAVEEVFVVDMPGVAQQSTVYNNYLDSLARTAAEEVSYYAVSLVGPKKKVDKLVKKFSLLR